MTTVQQYLRLFILGMVFTGYVILPYIQYKFYDTLMVFTGTSNTQLGFFMVAFTIVGMCFYVPMGVLADRKSAKMQVFYLLLLNAALNLAFTVFHTYVAGLIIWALLGLSCSLWAALIKLVRESGSGEEQGKVFGFFYASNGLTASAVGISCAWIFSHFDVPIEGLKTVLYVQASFVTLAALLLLFFVKNKTQYSAPESSAEVSEGNKSLDLVKSVLTLPATWIMIVFVFCGYGVFIGVGYTTPYATNVLGISLTFGAILGTIRQYFLRVITAPAGGYLIDKIGSPSKVMIGTFILVIVSLLVLLNMPSTLPVPAFIAMIMIFSCFAQLIYTLMFTVLEEVKIPPHLTATAVGIISVLGYIPDALFPPIFGYWLDLYGMKNGYTIIFGFLIVLSIISALVCLKIARDSKKKRDGEIKKVLS